MAQKPCSAEAALGIVRAFISHYGGDWSEWHVGVASDWKERLFEHHNAQPRLDSCTFVECASPDDARSALKALRELGCDGRRVGGDDCGVYLYAYRKGPTTYP
jgi:hypothetical protein